MVRRLRSEKPKVRNQLTAAALFPLYVNAASRERATKVAAAAESRLLKPGGLTTTTVNSGQQWDAPNGWAPLQWVAVEGLQNYGQQKIAMEVTWRFLTNVQHTYDSKQKLVEKYDVSSTGTGGGGGEYPLQDGFGWTNGVTLKMLDLICPQEKPCDALPATRPATTPSPQDKPVAAPAANDPALRNRKRPAPDASPPPTKIGRGEAVSWSLSSRADPFCGSRETLPHPRVEQVTFFA